MFSRGSRSWALQLSLLLLFLFGSSRIAKADPFEEARAVFQQAQELYEKGQYAEAAERYTAAYRLMRSPLLFFNIAQARRLQFQRDGDHRALVGSREHYERFLKEAEPKKAERERAESNLREVESVSIEEAKKHFAAAETSMRLSQFASAINDYEAAYDLSRRAGILFNLAQAERKQFASDGKLDRLARAEDLVLTYRRESKGQVSDEVIEQILAEIRTQRAEYYRKRDAEARTKEPAPMREAREMYQRGDAGGALTALTAAEKIQGNERVVLLQIYRLRGQAAAMAGQEVEAVDAFTKYLALEPAADNTGLQKDAVKSFDLAKAFWKGKVPLKIEHLPPGKVPPGEAVSIPVRIASDPLQMVAKRELHYRKEGSKQYEVITMKAGRVAARLPNMPPPLVGTQYRMEYFIVALDKNNAVLDTIGTSNAPLAFLVTEDAVVRPPPIYKRWWFWAAAGAVVAGTVATIAILNADGLPNDNITGDVSQGIR